MNISRKKQKRLFGKIRTGFVKLYDTEPLHLNFMTFNASYFIVNLAISSGVSLNNCRTNLVSREDHSYLMLSIFVKISGFGYNN